MRIADICTRNVICSGVTASLRDAAETMRQRHVGALVVLDQPDGVRVPVGIITDRDIVLAVVAEGVEVEALTVEDVMTRDPVTCTLDQGLFDAIETMRIHGVRRLPVLNAEGELAGMLAADDVYGALGTYLHELSRALVREQVRELETRP